MKKCENCGIEIAPSRKKYCSRECIGSAWSKRNLKFIGGPQIRKCAVCEKEYLPGKFAQGRQRCCSKICMRKLYYLEHREEAKAKTALWVKNNRERANFNSRNWRKRNLEKRRITTRIQQQRRTARIYNAGNNTLTAQEWNILCRIYQGKCFWCGEVCNQTIDHVLPISRGGQNCKDNVVPACFGCNLKKRTNIWELPDGVMFIGKEFLEEQWHPKINRALDTRQTAEDRRRIGL